MSEATKSPPVGLFWDHVNLSPSIFYHSGYGYSRAFIELAEKHGRIETSKVYAQSETMNQGRRNELGLRISTNIVDCANATQELIASRMTIDMFVFAIEHPAPATLIIACGDPGLSYAIAKLRLRGYRVILIGRDAVHPSLEIHSACYLTWGHITERACAHAAQGKIKPICLHEPPCLHPYCLCEESTIPEPCSKDSSDSQMRKGTPTNIPNATNSPAPCSEASSNPKVHEVSLSQDAKDEICSREPQWRVVIPAKAANSGYEFESSRPPDEVRVIDADKAKNSTVSPLNGLAMEANTYPIPDHGSVGKRPADSSFDVRDIKKPKFSDTLEQRPNHAMFKPLIDCIRRHNDRGEDLQIVGLTRALGGGRKLEGRKLCEAAGFRKARHYALAASEEGLVVPFNVKDGFAVIRLTEDGRVNSSEEGIIPL